MQNPSLLLPRFRPGDSAERPPGPRRAPGAHGDPGRACGERVLIVEDNWLVAIEMEAAFVEAGYTVLGIAVSAREAVELSASERPDVVLMDIRLQGASDGIAAATEIRQRLGVPSIFVSAHDDPETRARGEAARPLGWIIKPIQGAALVERVGRLLERPN